MAGGFQSTRKAGDFPSMGRTATSGGAGTGEVDTVNGVSPDAKGNVQLTANDVGADARGEAAAKFEGKRATGTIGQADDPTAKPEGDYYVTEKFIDAPPIASGQYVGLIRIDLDFDGSNNGGLIAYHVGDNIYYKLKFAGGWESWFSMTTSRAAPQPQFDASMFQSAVDRGYAADDQGIKSSKTVDGWWIFKDLKSVGGRPPESVGDLIVFKNAVTDVDPSKRHAFVLAMGKDTSGNNDIWVMYRDGDRWSAWFKVTADLSVTVDGIVADIAKLKTGDADLVGKVSSLTTDLGAVYAPNKGAFDSAVNALINEALKNYTPKSGGHSGDKPSLVYPRFYAQFSNSIPTSFTGATTSTNSEATLIRIPSERSRIFISIENDNDEASKVKGFKFNNKQEMSLEGRDIVVQGKKYRSFYTSGAFTDKQVEIKVDFGQGI